jgi:glycosyltransferase involved in cell wall biosynthesis
MSRRMYFYRDFRQFTGGHLKVWDYFQHVRRSGRYDPCIFFSRQTVWDDTNPWRALRDAALKEWRPGEADCLFVAGLDWAVLPESLRKSPRVPVINLIQHVRHAVPKDPRFPFLRYRAVRICVGEAVKAALEETNRVNGPLYAIPNCIDLELLPKGATDRGIAVLIAGLKRPELAAEMDRRLRHAGVKIHTLAAPIPRREYLDLVARARITVFLPNESEGFYLPGLEGLALGTLVICPVHAGERSHYRHGYNCFTPEYSVDALLACVEQALSLSGEALARLVANASATANGHALARERERFLEILGEIERIW